MKTKVLQLIPAATPCWAMRKFKDGTVSSTPVIAWALIRITDDDDDEPYEVIKGVYQTEKGVLDIDGDVGPSAFEYVFHEDEAMALVI
jgi:hypothetical protein